MLLLAVLESADVVANAGSSKAFIAMYLIAVHALCIRA
jgi:hypothetical protein